MKLKHLKLFLEKSVLTSIERHSDDCIVTTYTIPPNGATISLKYVAICMKAKTGNVYEFLGLHMSFDGFKDHSEPVDCSTEEVESLSPKRKDKNNEEELNV